MTVNLPVEFGTSRPEYMKRFRNALEALAAKARAPEELRVPLASQMRSNHQYAGEMELALAMKSHSSGYSRTNRAAFERR